MSMGDAEQGWTFMRASLAFIHRELSRCYGFSRSQFT
jgi:hypothetical protein